MPYNEALKILEQEKDKLKVPIQVSVCIYTI